MTPKAIPFHAFANLFPLIEGAEFEAFTDDVKTNGQADPIDLFEGSILDGRNRYRACVEARVAPVTRVFKGTAQEALAYVISKNIARRHLNESQRAMVAARLASFRQGERTDRMASVPKRGAERPVIADTGHANRNLTIVGYLPDKHDPANLPGISQPTAAKTLNVSERSLRSARTVQQRGTPELIAAVDHGKLAVSIAAQAANLTPDQQRSIAREADAGRANVVRSVLKRDTRSAQENALARKQLALPDQRYGVILADAPWRFEPYSRETGMDRAADQHYPTSDTGSIAASDIASIAADDCVIFLWATAPMIEDALLVMKGWGFTYKAQCVWSKLRSGAGRGTGYWFTGEHELLLVGTRGHVPAPAPGTQWRSVVTASVGQHSEKPDVFYKLIEEYFPTLPKIELHARRAREGWDRWGLDAPPEDAAA